MFARSFSERNDVYAPEPNGWDRKSNCAVGVSTSVMFFSLASHLRMSGLRVHERLDRIAEVEIELTTLGGVLRAVRHVVVNRLPMEDISCVCGNDGVLSSVSQDVDRR